VKVASVIPRTTANLLGLSPLDQWSGADSPRRAVAEPVAPDAAEQLTVLFDLRLMTRGLRAMRLMGEAA